MFLKLGNLSDGNKDYLLHQKDINHTWKKSLSSYNMSLQLRDPRFIIYWLFQVSLIIFLGI